MSDQEQTVTASAAATAVLPEGDDPPRREVKMVCQESARPAILSFLHTHALGVREVFPPRRVQSIYLDTHDGRSLSDNLGGIGERDKTRFRWYGDRADKVRGVLERKMRRDDFIWKERFVVAEEVAVEGQNRFAFVQHLRAACSHEWLARLSPDMEPSQWVVYDRAYYATGEGKVRITVDHRVRLFDLRDRFILTPKFPTPVPDLCILECKAEPDHEPMLRAFLNEMPFVRDRCSKFVLGCAPNHFTTLTHFPE